MASDGTIGSDWTPGQIDLIVADYFAMLADEIAGRPFVKARRNEAMQALTGRSRGSVEFKHQNISAVMAKLGRPWVLGYKPLYNFQNALIDGVERFLAGWDEATLLAPPRPDAPPAGIVAEPESLWIGPPPAPEPDEERGVPEPLQRLIRKFDPAARDARNRALGKRGEALVFAHERVALIGAGRDDLARRVRWTAEEDGDGAGYDIASFAADGRERLIEVKTTVGGARTPFWLSENERAFSEERSDAFRLVRVYDFARRPTGWEMGAPLAAAGVRLEAAVWRGWVG